MHGRAVGGEQPGLGRALALPGAGDHDDLAEQPHGVTLAG